MMDYGMSSKRLDFNMKIYYNLKNNKNNKLGEIK